MPLLTPLADPALDLTELPGTGSLYDGGDVIEQAEQLAGGSLRRTGNAVQRRRVHTVHTDDAAARCRRWRPGADGAHRAPQRGPHGGAAGIRTGMALALAE